MTTETDRIHLERYNLARLRSEAHPLHRLLAENPQHPLNPRAAALHERDPMTPALLLEASIPPFFHRLLLSLRPSAIVSPWRSPTPATSSASNAPTTTGERVAPLRATIRADDRRRRARDHNRIGAAGSLPISAEAAAECTIIMTVISDRRATGDWTRWWEESQDYIAQVIPSRRQLLQSYAGMRALIRRRRTTWKLAEHITDLDDTLDAFK